MTKRRTLDLPDAPGVWLGKCLGVHIECVRFYGTGDGSLFYYDSHGNECHISELLAAYPGGKWQGPISNWRVPIRWEDSNAKDS